MPYKDKEANRVYQIKWRLERRAQLSALKDVPCKDCGNKFPPYVMDFDHGDNEKLGRVTNMAMKNWEALLAEVAKCDVVCANCHRIRTFIKEQHIPKQYR